MKISLNGLRQYVDYSGAADDLAELLTNLGLEVEGVERIAGAFDGIVVAQVISRDKHPNADKLSVCKVNDGRAERQIVCGAQNFNAGDKVPLILPGASLPAKPSEKPFVISIGKIRGVESHGMMCSPQELGLAEDSQGLMILPESAQVGVPFGVFLGRANGDVIFDLEITPNRPDWNSLIGVAREVAAATGLPLKLPVIKLPEGQGSQVPMGNPARRLDDLLHVGIQDGAGCPRYTARLILGVKVGPSPDWLRDAVEKCGVRSINNVVDVTNFVMLETGQPLHAFDYRLLATDSASGKPAIIVRRAASEERFTTLDGIERKLDAEFLLIADPVKAVALAGVMGGLNSEITATTADVLIESAYFAPTLIRRASKRLELRTESSYRFERGGDPGMCDWASRRAAQLILETAGGTLVEGVSDSNPEAGAPRCVALRHRRVNSLLGIEVTPSDQTASLTRLFMPAIQEPSPSANSTESTQYSIPSFRGDVKVEADLIEEIVRLYGVNRIPPSQPRGAIGSNPFDEIYDSIMETRRLLAGLGLDEAQGQTLISNADAAFFTQPEQVVALDNPLSSDMDVLRPSLLPGLLACMRHNLHRQTERLALFEIGRVFVRSGSQVKEERRVAVLMTGPRDSAYWTGAERGAPFDVYDLKGILEEWIERSGLRGVACAPNSESGCAWLEAANLSLGGKIPVASFGQLSPVLAKRYDARHPVFMAEANLETLLARRNTARAFKSLPLFPAIRRDAALILSESQSHEAVLAAVRKNKTPNLESVELFDVFRGKNIPEGQKSVAYSFTYRSPERTLTDAEVGAAHEKLVAHLKQTLSASVRE